MTLETIVESYHNGQRKQYIAQVKQYGVQKYHIDLLDYLETLYSPPRCYIHYTELIAGYHKINRALR